MGVWAVHVRVRLHVHAHHYMHVHRRAGGLQHGPGRAGPAPTKAAVHLLRGRRRDRGYWHRLRAVRVSVLSCACCIICKINVQARTRARACVHVYLDNTS